MKRCPAQPKTSYGCVPMVMSPHCRYCGIAMDAPLARNSDPETSHAAAAVMAGSRTQRGLKALIVRALTERDGMTSGEIADHVGEPHERIWRRVSDVKGDGLIYADGTRVWHGRSQQVWRLARGD